MINPEEPSFFEQEGASETPEEKLDRLRRKRDQLAQQMDADVPSDASRRDSRTLQHLDMQIRELEAQQNESRDDQEQLSEMPSFKSCESFADLYNVLAQLEHIESASRGAISAQKVADDIEAIERMAEKGDVSPLALRSIPRAHDLRDTVERLARQIAGK